MSAKPSRVLLCSPQYLIDNSVLNSNIEQKILSKIIRTTEDKIIQPLIGSELYQEIVSQISGGTMTAGNNKTLLDDYILPTLAEYSVLEYIPYTALKFRNKGVQKQTSQENSEPASMEDLTYLTQSCRDSAQFYAERLIKFLKANIQSYPAYYRYTTIDSISPAKNDYFSGIQFPNSNRGDCGLFGLGTGIDINY
jgi:hypothetical protein